MRSPEIPHRLVSRRAAIEHTPPVNCLRGLIFAIVLFAVALGAFARSSAAVDAPAPVACQETESPADMDQLTGPITARELRRRAARGDSIACTRVAMQDAGAGHAVN